MEFIEQSFENLRNHLINNGLNKKKSSFTLIDSISISSTKPKDIDVFFLGNMIDREKTPRDKFYVENREYKVVDNYFDVYFAIKAKEFDTLSMIFRILVDFEVMENAKVFLLNATKELENSPSFVKYFLERNSSFALVKISVSVKSLVKPPIVKEVTKVDMLTQNIESIKPTKEYKKEDKKIKETIITRVDKDESKRLGKTKIVTEICRDYEKRILKKKDKK